MVAEDLGERTNIEVIDLVMTVPGLRLVDVGCGSGVLTRALAERGARAIGIEPDPRQAAENRRAKPVPGVEFAEAGAEALPLDDACVDGVFFSFSLHHVPPARMDTALAEAMRVLDRARGFLYVIEPVMAGSYAELVRPFNDETEVYRLARAALARCVARRFAEAREISYTQSVRFPDFESFLAAKLDATYTEHRREQIDTPEVRARFAAGRAGDGYGFVQRVRVDYYRRLAPGGSIKT